MLTYKYIPDIETKVTQYLDEHLKLAESYLSEGKLLLGGMFADPMDSGGAIFRTDDKADVEKFVNDDPYIQNGLVLQWAIREWNVVVGRT